ncbi:LolA family protein [Ovoidimarina sediminis]|uniref:LolA family protein n=1 Tax=Ovoidimarina sediminis TaxID=3079856 RepID=UPI002911B064|nr:outer membrane lipoprotein carrier protein LolA [Rhodophyticola sp. MJ-SS7]MDU8943801.1 outer membrane lipoprotein carrier protein LolA [Rhodophyticola sp. MJ-SS7]
MDRRLFLAGTVASFLATPAFAEVPLETLSEYFNAIRTLEARFTQLNADGSRSTGTLYMRRPGRARFEYDPPEESLVMAGGGQVAIFDGRSNAGFPEQYPLKRTPLYVILERNVDLENQRMVVGHRGDANRTILTAQDPDAPENGQVELVFQNEPLSLAGWTVIDAMGQPTQVRLDEIRLGGTLSAVLFNITHEVESRKR